MANCTRVKQRQEVTCWPGPKSAITTGRSGCPTSISARPGCQAYYLLDFLRTHTADTLYLVGDILDGWHLKKGWYWPQAHNDVVQKILRAARKGTKVVYIPGNHDERLRQFIGLQLGGITVAEDAIHVTADGKRLWVVHGDLFDARDAARALARAPRRQGLPAAAEAEPLVQCRARSGSACRTGRCRST